MLSLSLCLTDRVRNLPAFQTANRVLLYLATDAEISVDALADSCPEKSFYAPRCLPDRQMAIHAYHPATTTLQMGRHGIREPDPATSPALDPARIDLVIVPGLLFTPRGDRLGHGGGYFDCFLPRLTGAIRIAVTADTFVVPKLPVEPWDQSVRIVVTETAVHERLSATQPSQTAQNNR